jgi:2-methylcitrate dehydratase PrpD
MFPTDGGMHTSFQALQRLVQEHSFKAGDVQEINVWLNKNWADHVGIIRHPKDTVSAQYSMAFSLGLRLTRGGNELRDYMNPQLWSDREIMNAADKVQVHVDPNNIGGEKRYGVHMQVRLNDGRTLETDETYRKGSRQNPITRSELEAKFRSLAAARLDERRTREVVDMVSRLEKVRDAAELMPLLVGS